MDRRLLEYRPDIGSFESPVAPERQNDEFAADEMQHAAELLERVDEGGLEGYLVELIDRAARPRSQRVTEALAAILGHAARRLLGQREAPSGSEGRVLGLELEGLSPEDQVFEVARHFVRFACEAARRASVESGAGSAQAVARRAASVAARALAPGLLPSLARGGSATGFWFRRGRQLVVLNP